MKADLFAIGLIILTLGFIGEKDLMSKNLNKFENE